MNTQNIATALILASSTIASAGVVDMVYTGTGAGYEIQLQMEDQTRDVFAGEIYHDISGGVGLDAVLNGSQITFCSDITQIVATSTTEFTVTDIENTPLADDGSTPMGTQKADAIRALYSFSASTLMAGGLTDAYAVAFQLTIWEIVSDFDGTAASIDVNAGNTVFANTDGNALDTDVLTAITSLTNDMVTALGAGGGNFQDVLALANIDRQDQLVLVPSPGALSLLAAGGLIATRRRRS